MNPPAHESAIEFRALRKSFGGASGAASGTITALDGLNLKLTNGEIYGLLGANGAGKTTTLRIICGLLKPDSGEGHCLGQPLNQLHIRPPRGLGYMPQRGGLYDDLTIIENLRFFARAQGLPQPSARADQALQRDGLQQRAGQRVGTLSGGWRQRVALAAALLHSPRLLLLDEPTAGLDPQAREALWLRVRGLAAQGVTVLLTTHHVDEAERCDRIAYLEAGRLKVEDAPTRIAAALGIHAWHVSHADKKSAHALPDAPPPQPSLHIWRDADGWRVLSQHADLPDALIAWAHESGRTPEPVSPTLTDALGWLAIASGQP